MIPAISNRYFFRTKKKGIRTLPPKARIRGLSFVEAATDLSVRPCEFDAVLNRITFGRRYGATLQVESIRHRLFELAYRVGCKTPTNSASCYKSKSDWEVQYWGALGGLTYTLSLPAAHPRVIKLDAYIRSTLLFHDLQFELGFTRDIINDALGRSVPHRIAPARQKPSRVVNS